MRQAVTTAVVALLAGRLAAQAPLPRASETIEVSIVNVDVVVTDRHGKHIRGLKPADFEIRDNGVPQPITNFAEYEEAVVPDSSRPAEMKTEPSPDVATTPSREKRTIVLFVERQVLRPADADAFVASMKKLLHDTLQPGDTAAVVRFEYTTKVEQNFTGDLALLDGAIDRLRPMFDPFGEDTVAEAVRNEYWFEMMDEDARSHGASFDSAILNGTERAVRELVDIRRKVDTLDVFVNAMAGVDGRKAIFLATRRFGQYAGWEFIATGLGGALDDATRFDTRKLREDLARDANAAGVTFYAIYPEGLVDIPVANVETRPMSTRQMFANDPRRDMLRTGKANGILLNETKALGDLAADTGGVAGWGIGDIGKIESVLRDDLSSYYSLAFRAPKNAASHKITVTTKERGYRVRARHEFVVKTDEEQMSNRVVAALYQPQRASALPIDVQLEGVTKSKKRYRIPIVIRIPAASLTALPDANGRSGAFRVYAVAGNVLGVSSDVFAKSQPFTIPANATDADTKLFTYSFEMVTDTRADRIVIGVYDELSKQNAVIRLPLDNVTVPVPTSR